MAKRRTQQDGPPVGELLRRDPLQADVRAVDSAAGRQVELSFSSEEPVQRWWGTEVLSHDDGAVDMDRLQELGVVLFNHNQDAVLGRVVSAAVDTTARKARAIVAFDDDPQAEAIYQKVLAGTLRGVSVGYRVDVWEEVGPGATSTNGRFTGPVDIAVRWTPMEVSIVSVPADPSVGVARSADDSPEPGPLPAATEPEGEPIMPAENIPGTDERALPTTATGPTTADALAAERTRVAEIITLCRDSGLESAEYIRSGAAVVDVQRAALDALRARLAPVAPAPTPAQVGEEGVDKLRTQGTDALLLRGGVALLDENGKPRAAVDGAQSLRGLSLRDMLVEFHRLSGRADANRWEIQDLMRAALTPDSQFSGMLDATIGKALMVGHTLAATTFQLWTSRTTLGDFKSTPAFRLSEAGGFETIPQNGEIPSDEMSDEKVLRALATKGVRWGLSRQAIINDDLGYITKQPLAYAAAARRLVNTAVYAVLNNNAAIYDTVALFHNTHANLATSAAVPSVESIGVGRAAMRKQCGIRGLEALNIAPAFILGPPDLETKIAQVMTSTADPDGLNSGVANVVRGTMTAVADAALTDATAWFLAADPTQLDTIEVAYLNGQESPILESQMAFDKLGWEWRLYHDWAVTCLDYRGLYKNAGSSGGGS